MSYGAIEARLEAARVGARVGAGPNLYLVKGKRGASWIVLASLHGRRREIGGIGKFPAVSLDEATKRRDDIMADIERGDDPVAKRQAEREVASAVPTFAQAMRVELKRRHDAGEFNAATEIEWDRHLSRYASGLMPLLVNTITSAQVAETIAAVDSVTMRRKLQTRIAAIFDWAVGNEYRLDNPANRKVLKHRVAIPTTKTAKHTKRAACPHERVGEVLDACAGELGATACRLQVLTACRSDEVAGARWSEIDMARGVWTIPAERMKAGEEHKVPLSKPALALLNDMAPAHARRGYVFVGRTGRMNRKTLLQTIQRAAARIGVTAPGGRPITVHGMRSAFVDWATERGYAHETIMDCIAHAVGSESDRAYRRTANLPQRHKIMDAWAEYIAA